MEIIERSYKMIIDNSKALTKRDLIVNKYLEIKDIIDGQEYARKLDAFFPSLEDLDITDIIFQFSFTFSDVSQIDGVVKSVINTHQIDLNENEQNDIVGYVTDFYEYLKRI
jgi:hypothetical protein